MTTNEPRADTSPYVDLELTIKGKNLQAKINAGKGNIELKYTRIMSASGFSENPTELLTLIEPRQEFVIESQNTFGKRAEVTALMTNFGNPLTNEPPLEEGYVLQMLGFYAEDPDEGEILYMVSQFENPNFVPPFSRRPWRYNPTFEISVGNAQVVHFAVRDTDIVSRNMLDFEISRHNSDPNAHSGMFAIIEGLTRRIEILEQRPLIPPQLTGVVAIEVNGEPQNLTVVDRNTGIASPVDFEQRNIMQQEPPAQNQNYVHVNGDPVTVSDKDGGLLGNIEIDKRKEI